MEPRVEKPWYKSKRMWFNIVMGIGAVLAQHNVIPADAVAGVGAIGNVILNSVSDGAKLTLVSKTF